jgi:hypothetical protein
MACTDRHTNGKVTRVLFFPSYIETGNRRDGTQDDLGEGEGNPWLDPLSLSPICRMSQFPSVNDSHRCNIGWNNPSETDEVLHRVRLELEVYRDSSHLRSFWSAETKGGRKIPIL